MLLGLLLYQLMYSTRWAWRDHDEHLRVFANMPHCCALNIKEENENKPRTESKAIHLTEGPNPFALFSYCPNPEPIGRLLVQSQKFGFKPWFWTGPRHHYRGLGCPELRTLRSELGPFTRIHIIAETSTTTSAYRKVTSG